MRIHLLYLLLLTGLIFPFMNQAQEHHCAMVPYDSLIRSLDPSYASRREKMEKEIQTWISENREKIDQSKDLIRIPVVVHILYNTDEQNVPDQQVYNQIWSLNRDFRRQNPDTLNTPEAFRPFAADCKIEFCLAVRTPENQSTNGIVRKATDKTEFQLDNSMKSDFKGGSSPWNPDEYLNIWVCKLAGNYLGFSQYPGGTDSTDGVVIDYQVFGWCANLHPHYNFGRTATHECGHYLDLIHIWGDDFGSCQGSDYVDDTPNARDANYYCPEHPRTTSCNPDGEMFMNYMDYVYDACFNLYTQGQRDRMLAAINLYRSGLMTSAGCSPVIGVEEHGNSLNMVAVSPNPAHHQLILENIPPDITELQILIRDIHGRIIRNEIAGVSSSGLNLDIEGITPGFYLLQVKTSTRSGVFKIIIY